MKSRIIIKPTGEKVYRRFGISIRIQHIILMLSTILLIITGLPLKFFTSGWAIFIMDALGGPENARELHHLGALGLIFVGIFHLGYIVFSKSGRTDFKLLIPTKKDFLDFFNQIKYFFGRSKVKAKFGRFSFIEKFDYWAVYWGFVIMIGSGLVMWIFQGSFHPSIFGNINIPFFQGAVDSYIHAISRELHSDEALLATLAIIIWHFYNVHFNPDKFPGSNVWLTGKMSKHEMEEEHPIELEEIESKEPEIPVTETVIEEGIEDSGHEAETLKTPEDQSDVKEIIHAEAKEELSNENKDVKEIITDEAEEELSSEEEIKPEDKPPEIKNEDENKKE
jgi:formate dehydrogenase subunit gamma